jgi:hypothetical protein
MESSQTERAAWRSRPQPTNSGRGASDLGRVGLVRTISSTRSPMIALAVSTPPSMVPVMPWPVWVLAPARNRPLIGLRGLEPYPDEMLGLDDGFAAPEARYEQREGVELAFVEPETTNARSRGR